MAISGTFGLHPGQRQAVETHDKNIIVVASAGSGKTRVLVERYVSLLEAHPDWPLASIVAITFTTRAAREMRDRVRLEIEQRVATASRDEDRRRWRDVQAVLDSARIGTIHSLCATILRANAAEARIDPGFEVLDELEATLLAEDAVEEALAQLAEQGGTAIRLLVEYGAKATRAGLRDFIHADPGQLPTDSPIEQWRADYEAAFADQLAGFVSDEAIREALHWEPSGGFPDADDKLAEAWQQVVDGRERLTDPAYMLDALTAWARLPAHVGTQKAWGSKEALEEARSRLKLIKDRSAAFIKAVGAPPGEYDEMAAERLPLWGEAIRHVQAAYARMKAERRALDFDDLETLTRRLLSDNPAVQGRYQHAEFKHILVDEFQDTNAVQRDIIYALADTQRGGSLFVVGDPKQSIYQFRGADVRVFGEVRREITRRHGIDISLSVSFRAHHQLIDGFNAVFGALLGDTTQAEYEVSLDEPLQANRASEMHHTPTFECILIEKDRAEEERRGADDLRRWEAWTLAQRVQELIASGKPIWDKAAGSYRPLRYGDVAVLVRATNSMTPVEEAFKAVSIPYITLAGKGYYNRPEVWDLLNLLKALYNRADNLSLAAALRSPLFGLSDEDLLALRLPAQHDPTASLWVTLTDPERVLVPPPPNRERVQTARAVLLPLAENAGRVTIAELLSRAVESTAYLATLTGLPDGARKVANVEKLIELARHSGRIGLGEFTAYTKELTDRETRESEALIEAEDLVSVMTVHASKGLEFPVVALFDAAWSRSAEYPTLLIDPDGGAACTARDSAGKAYKPFAYRVLHERAQRRERAESKRLLYVAMTRAQDYLIVSGRNAEADTWLSHIKTALGLPESILPDETRLIEQAWGSVLLRSPLTQPDDAVFSTAQAQPATGWDAARAIAPEDIPATPPPLLVPLSRDETAPSRVMDARELSTLGEAKALPNLRRFRSHLLYGAPTEISNVSDDTLVDASLRRIVGTMVHRAARFNRFPGNTSADDLRRILRSYAWEAGITEVDKQDSAIADARGLLERIEVSSILQRIRGAEQVYHELPFTLQLHGRTVNGVIDVLFFARHQWHVVDFKSAWVDVKKLGGELTAAITRHAERYFAQVGVYAAAVQQMTGQQPDVHIHYVRYVYTVTVPPEAWRAAFDRLDTDIQDALNSS